MPRTFLLVLFGKKETKNINLSKASNPNFLHMFIYSGGGFKLWVTNKVFKGKLKDDHEESVNFLFHPQDYAE